MARYAIHVLSRSALPLAQALGQKLGAVIHAPERFAASGMTGFASLRSLMKTSFTRFDGHVFIAATGIVVRTIAPHLSSKAEDPAVVCMDPQGRHVISLLSGHLGGANDLAIRCAAITGGQAVITTATDTMGVPSVDMLARERNLHIIDLDTIKDINAAFLEGRSVQIHDPLGCLGELDGVLSRPVEFPEDWHTGEPGIWVHWKHQPACTEMLRLVPRILTLGVGCRRGTSGQDIHAFVSRVLKEHDLLPEAVDCMGTADIKRDEQGLLEAAEELNVSLRFFSGEVLAEVDSPTPSSMVEQHVGTPSVCEAAALLLSDGGELVVPKQKTDKVTVAVARRKQCWLP